jgi:hypothetical protein
MPNRRAHSLHFYTIDSKVKIFTYILKKTFFEGLGLKESIVNGLNDGTLNFFAPEDYTEEQKINKLKSQFYYLLENCNQTLQDSKMEPINLQINSPENKAKVKEVIDMITSNQGKIFFGNTVKKNIWSSNEQMRNTYIYNQINQCKDLYEKEKMIKTLSKELRLPPATVKSTYAYVNKKENEALTKKYKNLTSVLSDFTKEELEKIEILTRIIQNIESSHLSDTQIQFAFNQLLEHNENKSFIIEVPGDCPRCGRNNGK